MALVKFPLIMADGFKANTLEEFKEHFDIKSVVGYFYDRRLIRWLKVRNYAEEAAQVEEISKLDRDAAKKLGAIFGIEIVDGGEETNITTIMNRLKQLTADKKLLAQVEQELTDGSALVVFTQAEFDAEAQDCDRVYLASSQFVIPLNETDKTYIGIGENVRAVIKSDKIVDFAALNITFEKIAFDDEYKKILAKANEDDKARRAEELYEEAVHAGYGEDDWSTALEKYKQSAELGYPKAFVDIGNIYIFGEGDIEQDINEARRWYKRGMEKNDADSFGWYALSLNRDDASEADKREAFSCMKRATELAPESGGWWLNLGDMYRDGTGTEKNLAKTVECYEKALQFGNSRAANYLGVMYGNGEYVEQNLRKAFELYKQAVELDDFNINTAAMKHLAYYYRDGIGTEKNPALAFKYYKQAAEAGDVDAMNWTGFFYYNGEGTSKDFTQAFKWCKQAAEAGHVDAMNWTGSLYRDGEGTEKSIPNALKWFEKSAEGGNNYAMFNIALIYDNGDGVPVDYRKAFEWYKQAAEAGNVTAMNNLGYAYNSGLGVAVDYEQAAYWYKQAAEAGSTTAMRNLADLYYNGSGMPVNYSEAFAWYKKAAEAGNTDAMNIIGVAYLDGGLGVNPDYAQAEYWFKKAAEAGSETAKKNLQILYDRVNAETQNNNNSDDGCFITTAVCESFGKPDDCYELTTFRNFRDGWLTAQPDGKALIAEYYSVAPKIVDKINRLPNVAQIYQNLWQKYLAPCLAFIESGDNSACKRLYVEMVTSLKKKFLDK